MCIRDRIPLAFGSQWVPAVTVVQILAVYIISRTLQTWNNAVMDAAGKPHVSMILNAVTLMATLPAIVLGNAFGIEGVAVAFGLAAVLFGELPSFVITTRELRLGALSVLGRIWEVVLFSAAACIAVALARHQLEDAGMAAEARVALLVLLGAAIYVACMTLLARSTTRQLLRIVRNFGPAMRPKS